MNEPTLTHCTNWFLHCVLELIDDVSKVTKMSICSIQHALLTEEYSYHNPPQILPPTEDKPPIQSQAVSSPTSYPKLFLDTKITPLSLRDPNESKNSPPMPKFTAGDNTINKNGVLWERDKSKEKWTRMVLSQTNSGPCSQQPVLVESIMSVRRDNV